MPWRIPLGARDAIKAAVPLHVLRLWEKAKERYLLMRPTIRNAKAIVRSRTRQR